MGVNAASLPEANSSALLQAQGLDIVVGGQTLCKGLNLQVFPGQRWLVLGENGSGKSTLLATLAGWLEPAAGMVCLQGQPVRKMPRRQRACNLAWLGQQDEVSIPVSVLDKVCLGRHPWLGFRGLTPSDEYLAMQQLERLELAALAGRDWASLSGGERRRVGLAAVLCQQAQVMLLDEPLSQLDVRHQQQALQVLVQEADGGRGVVWVSHDVNHAFPYASHALLLSGNGAWDAGPVGQMLTEERLSALYRHPMSMAVVQGRTAVFAR